MSVTLFGCAGGSNSAGSNSTVGSATSSAPAAEKTATKDFPDGNYKDTGKGIMYLSTAGGTSENGNIPVIYASTEDELTQIEIDTESLNNKNLSYIYVDGMKNGTDQLGDTQTSIDLQGDALKVGKHKVEVVQYKNDKTDGKIITYKPAQYQVKSK